MIWFNIKKLEQGLAEEKISERHGFYYLLASIIISAIAGLSSKDKMIINGC